MSFQVRIAIYCTIFALMGLVVLICLFEACRQAVIHCCPEVKEPERQDLEASGQSTQPATHIQHSAAQSTRVVDANGTVNSTSVLIHPQPAVLDDGVQSNPRNELVLSKSLVNEGLCALGAAYCPVNDNSDQQCSICMDELPTEGTGVFQSPRCSHAFHLRCLSQWVAAIKSHNLLCPNCRESFTPPEVDGTTADKLYWAKCYWGTPTPATWYRTNGFSPTSATWYDTHGVSTTPATWV